MHHTRIGAVPELFRQDAGHVVISGPGVNDQRQAAVACGGDMDAQRLLLNGGSIGGVVVIEAGFADGDEFRMPRERYQLVNGDKRFFGGAHRVGACGVEDAGIGFCDGADAGFVAEPCADGDDAGDARSTGAGQDIGQFAVEIGEVEMAVAVGDLGRLRHRELTPGQCGPPLPRLSGPYQAEAPQGQG